MQELIIISASIFICWLVYKFWISAYQHWEKRGVPYVPGTFPFGSDSKLTKRTVYQGIPQYEMYKKFSSEPYFGIFMMRSPILVVKSPEIISIILAKEFSHFRDRQNLKIHEKDVLSQHLFNLQGDIWKAVRGKLSPAFTSGKIKTMFPLFIKCAENLETLLLHNYKTAMDAKHPTACFTIDVICNSIFGIEANTMSNANNEIRSIGIRAVNISLKAMLQVMLKTTFPEIGHLFPIKFFDEEMETFFLKFINDSIQYREENNVKRNDFLDLLIQLKHKGMIDRDTKREKDEQIHQTFDMSLELMAAQCFVFFAAGFETSSSTQSFTLFEVALNPDIQKKIQNEIDSVIKKYGDITFDAVREMTYLDMAISETMRKYPAVPFLRRVCTKPLKLPDGLNIEKGDQMFIPLWSLHHDPQYFPDPDKYDPERFSEENGGLIKPYTYMPFGEGPRFCIGMQFGLLQIKVGLITILRKYNVEPTENTIIPIVLKGASITTGAKDPINLKFIPR